VFAAGNVLHGAEAAGTAALEGRACAVSVAGFVADPGRGWPREPPVRVEPRLPLSWIVPGALHPLEAPPREFRARVAVFLGGGAFEVRQDGRLLHRAPFLSLVPNRSIRLSGRWARDVRPDGGAVVVSAVTRSSQGAPP
jgi:hypothetical protein